MRPGIRVTVALSASAVMREALSVTITSPVTQMVPVSHYLAAGRRVSVIQVTLASRTTVQVRQLRYLSCYDRVVVVVVVMFISFVELLLFCKFTD